MPDPHTQSHESTGPQVRVLLIEDSPIIRDGLVELINGDPRCKVMLSTDSEFEAVRELAAHEYDIAVVDLQLKHGTGLGVLRFLQDRGELLKIVLTNFNSPQMRERCLSLGADYYFDKSREFDAVMRAIDSWIGQQGGASATARTSH